MRVILDTNIVMSAVFFGGVPGQILAAWHEHRVDIVVSPSILVEYRQAGEILSTKYPEVDSCAVRCFPRRARNRGGCS